MRYLGGKTKIAKKIAEPLLDFWNRSTYSGYAEPFVGSASVASALVDVIPSEKMILSDASLDLILLYQAIQQGWTPPTNVTEIEYKRLNATQPSALRGFVGYGCSFGGKFFGGYARGEGRNYAKESCNAINKTVDKLKKATFLYSDFLQLTFNGRYLIYCDPPYANTTRYGNVNTFDHLAFWDVMRNWRRSGHTVVISEYQAPSDFSCIWQYTRSTNIRTKTGNEPRGECLFI